MMSENDAKLWLVEICRISRYSQYSSQEQTSYPTILVAFTGDLTCMGVAKFTTWPARHVFNFCPHFQVSKPQSITFVKEYVGATYLLTFFRFIIVGKLSSLSNAHANLPKLRIDEIRGKRVSLFEKEYKRQQALISRLEKIEVTYQGLNNESTTLIMNKGVSTPYNCAQRKLTVKQYCVKFSLFTNLTAYFLHIRYWRTTNEKICGS